MSLRVISWNLRRAKKDNPVWNILVTLDPDLVLLQEVSSIPDFIFEAYTVLFRKASTKKGSRQRFGTAILAKGEVKELPLESNYDWVNRMLEKLNGNLIGAEISLDGLPPIHAISVYSPAWPLDGWLEDIDVSQVKLTQNRQVWGTEILWAVLQRMLSQTPTPWIVGGDFNSSVTFDYMWGNKPRGNQEVIDRLNALGLTECLAHHVGELVPTFRNSLGGKIIHQIDHLYVTKELLNSLQRACVLDDREVFENRLSDHLPIVAEFNLPLKNWAKWDKINSEDQGFSDK